MIAYLIFVAWAVFALAVCTEFITTNSSTNEHEENP